MGPVTRSGILNQRLILFQYFKYYLSLDPDLTYPSWHHGLPKPVILASFRASEWEADLENLMKNSQWLYSKHCDNCSQLRGEFLFSLYAAIFGLSVSPCVCLGQDKWQVGCSSEGSSGWMLALSSLWKHVNYYWKLLILDFQVWNYKHIVFNHFWKPVKIIFTRSFSESQWASLTYSSYTHSFLKQWFPCLISDDYE